MKQTQGERLAQALRSCPHTYLEMQQLGISTSPQKRLREWESRQTKYRIVVSLRYQPGGRYLTTWSVQLAPKA